jgi:hypothetical protein
MNTPLWYYIHQHLPLEQFVGLPAIKDIFELKNKRKQIKTNRNHDFLSEVVATNYLNIDQESMEGMVYILKLLPQTIGHLHEQLMAKLGGCVGQHRIFEDDNRCYDIVNHHKKIIAEIQNCDNTKNGDGTTSIRRKLQKGVEYLEGYKGYQVVIYRTIEKKTLSIFGDNIFIVSGEYFYHELTNDKHFFQKLTCTIEKIFTLFNSFEDFICACETYIH